MFTTRSLHLAVHCGLISLTGYRVPGKCSCFSLEERSTNHLCYHWNGPPFKEWEGQSRQGREELAAGVWLYVPRVQCIRVSSRIPYNLLS
jgi:hypothetical protein